MIRSFLAATAVLSLSTAVQAQAPAPPAAQGQPADVGLLPGAELSADCGGLNNLAGRAWCVTAPLGQVGALADAYIADLATKGWLAAGGDENRVVFVKRREAGGCDGMQMVAFYDTTKTAVAELPAYLGFAVVPGDVCAQPAAE
ncbi:MAG: hypothetical protein KKD26_02050, partial [Alphaproteobacteria bacterium]|nr:hypothetical protein [Alphaproteobacteria bacterium]